MTSTISLAGVTKRYAGAAAVDQLTLEIPAGSVFALLGDNGAGKSTTIRVLTGMVPPDAGRATILGLDCWRDAVALRQRVGYVPEKPRFYDWMTVGETGWFVAGFYPPGFHERYLKIIGGFRLTSDKRLSHLTKGGYAKVGLALALAHEPDVLILDEPTSGLDLFTRRDFLRSMVDLAGEGRTILLSSHQIAEVERVASHVGFIAGGQLLLGGTLDEVRERVVSYRVVTDTPLTSVPPGLGEPLHVTTAGKETHLVVRDPRPGLADALRSSPGVTAVDRLPLSLEEIYAAVLGRADSAERPADRTDPVAEEVRS